MNQSLWHSILQVKETFSIADPKNSKGVRQIAGIGEIRFALKKQNGKSKMGK